MMGEWQWAGLMTEVQLNQRYSAYLMPEDGRLTCTEAGVCKSALAGPQLWKVGATCAMVYRKK